jgi:hypothetical protein
MKFKSIIPCFFLGGLFALIAQTFVALWDVLLAGTPMAFFSGGATLVSMGIVGCVLGGLGLYQYLEKWATFGALLPFSGFAMAVGMQAVTLWTEKNCSFGKCVWKCVWFVIKFNLVYAVLCIVIGFLYGAIGLTEIDWGIQPTTGGMLFVYAFLVGGILSALCQFIYITLNRASSKITPLHILIGAWIIGALIAPTGIPAVLEEFSGEGFAIMIAVGGYIMYGTGFQLFLGNIGVALFQLGAFMLAVLGLVVTSLGTFLIYNAAYGRKSLRIVHKEKAISSLEGLGYEVAVTDKQ